MHRPVLILTFIGRTDVKADMLSGATHEIREQYLDCTKAKEVLGWNTSYPLEVGLKKTIDWYAEHLIPIQNK